jgi:hypothetical protein
MQSIKPQSTPDAAPTDLLGRIPRVVMPDAVNGTGGHPAYYYGHTIPPRLPWFTPTIRPGGFVVNLDSRRSGQSQAGEQRIQPKPPKMRFCNGSPTTAAGLIQSFYRRLPSIAFARFWINPNNIVPFRAIFVLQTIAHNITL